jgi:hypothetical protein
MASPNGEGTVMRGLLLDILTLCCAAMLLLISVRSSGQAEPTTQAAMTQAPATMSGDMSGEQEDALRRLFVRREPETRGGSVPGPSTVDGTNPDRPTSQPSADLTGPQAEMLRKLMEKRARELGNPNPNPQLPVPGIPSPQ